MPASPFCALVAECLLAWGQVDLSSFGEEAALGGDEAAPRAEPAGAVAGAASAPRDLPSPSLLPGGSAACAGSWLRHGALGEPGMGLRPDELPGEELRGASSVASVPSLRAAFRRGPWPGGGCAHVWLRLLPILTRGLGFPASPTCSSLQACPEAGALG